MQQIKETNTPRLLLMALLLVVALGAALRVHRLGAESVWLDESYTVEIADGPLPSVIEETAKDVHPPLYYLALHYWMKSFGDSEFSLRFLSTIFGVLAIFVVYKLARLLFDRAAGLIAALLMALSRFNIEFSQEARMYMLLSLLGILSMYFFVRWLEGRSRLALAAYVALSALMTYTHVYSFFILAAQNLFLLTLFFTDRETFRRTLKLWLLAQASLFVLFLPWLSVLLQQVARVRKGFWIPKLPARFLFDTLIIHAGSRRLALLLFPLAALAVFRAIRGRVRSEGEAKEDASASEAASERATFRRLSEGSRIHLLLLWFACPIVLPFLVSQFASPIFLPKYTLAASVPFVILAARGLQCVRYHQLRLLVVVMLIGFSLTDMRDYYRTVKKDMWREAVASFGNKAEQGDLVLFNQQSGQSPFDYYNRRAGLVEKPFPDFDSELTIDNVPDLLRPAVEGHDRVWLVLSHPGPFTPMIPVYMEKWYGLASRETIGGVEMYLFEKRR